MTERAYSVASHNATPTQSSYPSLANHPAKDAFVPTDSVEEEPYTIKCICEFTDDDGNTILCETCDTWQHILCYYPLNSKDASREDFDHSCADCDPRPERNLDRRKATERQLQKRQERSLFDTTEKKIKRPPSKSHKKKPKPSELQINGFHHDDAHHGTKAGSPHDSQPHTKKSKTHKTHHSISSHAVKRSPSNSSRTLGHGHPISPVTTPPDLPDNLRMHDYNTTELRKIYDPLPKKTPFKNIFAQLKTPSSLMDWTRDTDKLLRETGIGRVDAFHIPPSGFDLETLRASQNLDVITETVPEVAGLRIRSLVLNDAVETSESILGELSGIIDFQANYAVDVDFKRLCHPPPLLFFHPLLPLSIDTRREGSICRYIRRSCKPNAALDAYVVNEDVHFFATSIKPIAAREKVTFAWDFRLPTPLQEVVNRVLELDDDKVQHDLNLSPAEFEELRAVTYTVLTEFGGCGCGLGAECSFMKVQSDYRQKFQPPTNGNKMKKGKRIKQISPNSTGQATNSRAASEGNQDVFDMEDDNRSASGSSRSKPQSRDMSPIVNGFGEISSDMITEREKRKLANIEKTFEKMEEQPPRKKKRTSDGTQTASGMNIGHNKAKQRHSTSMSNSVPRTNGLLTHGFVDAGTSRQTTSSPTIVQSPLDAASFSRGPSPHSSQTNTSRQGSVSLRPNYVSVGMQTDPDPKDWWHPPQPRTRVISIHEQIRRLSHAKQRERAAQREAQEAAERAAMMNGDGQLISGLELHNGGLRQFPSNQDGTERPRSGGSAMSVDAVSTSNDIMMTDAPQSFGATKPVPPLWQGPGLPPSTSTSPTENRATELRVQLPTMPSFSNMSPPGVPLTPSGLTTPSLTACSSAQSPFGTNFAPPFSPSIMNSIGQQPSPIKKKLSLKDYKAMKGGNKAAGDSNSSTTVPRHQSPSSMITEESKVQTIKQEPISATDPPPSKPVEIVAPVTAPSSTITVGESKVDPPPAPAEPPPPI